MVQTSVIKLGTLDVSLNKHKTDHLREERLAIHYWQIWARYVQEGGSQVNVQHRCLWDWGSQINSNVTNERTKRQHFKYNQSSRTFTICLGAMPGPRTMRGTRMSNSYSCLLSMGRENWPLMTKANTHLQSKQKKINPYSTRVRHSFCLRFCC